MRAHKLGKDHQHSPCVNSKCSSPNKVQLWSSQGIFEADANRLREHSAGKCRPREAVLLHVCLQTKLYS